MTTSQKPGPMAPTSMPAPNRVDVSALRDALAGGSPPVVIDVRMPFEFASGHVPGAVNIPLPRVGAAADDLSAHDEVWIICKSGSRSAAAAATLSSAGLQVVDVAGGTMAWRRAGFPVDKERSLSRLILPLLIALTLGLAPGSPEPHVLEKLRWVFAGADGMTLTDWFDLVLHGAPWVWLAWTAADLIRPQRSSGPPGPAPS